MTAIDAPIFRDDSYRDNPLVDGGLEFLVHCNFGMQDKMMELMPKDYQGDRIEYMMRWDKEVYSDFKMLAIRMGMYDLQGWEIGQALWMLAVEAEYVSSDDPAYRSWLVLQEWIKEQDSAQLRTIVTKERRHERFAHC